MELFLNDCPFDFSVELELLKSKLPPECTRLSHCIGIVNNYINYCNQHGVRPNEVVARTLLLHDIGYSKELQEQYDTTSHNLAGYLYLSTFMKNKVNALSVLLHGYGKGFNHNKEFTMESMLTLQVLDYFDVTTSHNGKQCTIDTRLSNIATRYGSDNRKYLRALALKDYFEILERAKGIIIMEVAPVE